MLRFACLWLNGDESQGRISQKSLLLNKSKTGHFFEDHPRTWFSGENNNGPVFVPDWVVGPLPFMAELHG